VSLRALCPHCHTVCELEDVQLAVAVPCPSCGGRFVLYGLAAAPALPDETAVVTPAPATTPPPPDSDVPPLSLQGGPPLAWIDRVLPRRPSTFLAAVFGIAAACWLLGLLLANDRARFLQTREWYAQLLYLPAHLITLRLFVTLYVRNFLAGVAHMNVPFGLAARGMRLVLGPAGLLALVLAVPLCASDYRDLTGEKYKDSLVGPLTAEAVPGDPDAPHAVGPADLLMWVIWCVEWVVNAYIWVLLLGFLALTMYVLRWFSFRESVEVVLHEKHYRPFLLMSGQGATIVLGFAVVNGLYIWFAGGDITDYIGIGVTIGLLLLGFGPPWLQLKSTVERVVNGEIYKLRGELIAGHRRQAALEKQGVAAPPDLTTRMNEALVLLRMDYLDHLGRQMGRSEGAVLILKLLAPTATIGWRLFRTFLGLP
jgi:hypothetical protein